MESNTQSLIRCLHSRRLINYVPRPCRLIYRFQNYSGEKNRESIMASIAKMTNSQKLMLHSYIAHLGLKFLHSQQNIMMVSNFHWKIYVNNKVSEKGPNLFFCDYLSSESYFKGILIYSILLWSDLYLLFLNFPMQLQLINL